MTMIDRLAAKVGNELYRQYDENARWSDAKDVIEDFDAQAVVRIIIEAMMEPTEAMVLAGVHHENLGDMEGRWQAMLRAILNEAPKSK